MSSVSLPVTKALSLPFTHLEAQFVDHFLKVQDLVDGLSLAILPFPRDAAADGVLYGSHVNLNIEFNFRGPIAFNVLTLSAR